MRWLIVLSALVAASYAQIESESVLSLASNIRSGTITSHAAVSAYISRINQYDGKLHSVIELNPDALTLAQEADAIVEACKGDTQCLDDLPPLLGVPILVKDNIATKDKMQTCAGSLALVGSIVPSDAPVVTRLKGAGAIILGKAGLTEWANFRGYVMTNGWSGRGGQVISAYDSSEDVCGSSSGCGVAVSAGFAPACIGTETFGSIQCPSMANRIFGMKPAPDLVPSQGIIPITYFNDVAGPMCRTVEDCELLYSLMTFDSYHVKSTKDEGRRTSRLKVGYLPNGITQSEDPEGFNRTQDFIAALKASGIGVVEIPFDMSEYLNASYPDIMGALFCDFKPAIEDYLSSLTNTTMKTLDDLRTFNLDNAEAERMSDFGQGLFDDGMTARNVLTDRVFCKNVKKEFRNFGKKGQYGIKTLMHKYDVDMLVGDTSMSFNTGFTYNQAAFAGFPSFVVPVLPQTAIEESPAHPFGMILTTTSGNEQAMFAVAKQVTAQLGLHITEVPALD